MEASDLVVVLALLVLMFVLLTRHRGLGSLVAAGAWCLLLPATHSKVATPGSIYVASSGLFSPVHRSVPSRRHGQQQLQYYLLLLLLPLLLSLYFAPLKLTR